MPRVDEGGTARHISMEEYERREARAESDAVHASGSKSDFAKMMQAIRDAYAKSASSGMHDSARFDRLVEDGFYNPARWPRQHVTNALIGISPKADFLDRKYYGGRFSARRARR